VSLSPDGVAGQIAALEPGKSVSVTVRVPCNAPHPDTKIARARTRLKNRMASYVGRARAASGGTFTTEVAVAHTHDFNATLVTVAVTRLTARRAAR
jgi:hypothetical protein